MKNNDIHTMIEALRRGDIVCLPTETVYGLAVDTHNPGAIKKLYTLKNRSTTKPMSVAISDVSQLKLFVSEISKDAEKLINRFWPGQLTLIFPANDQVPQEINNGNGKIGIRFSSDATLQNMIKSVGHPICLTSANLSGEKECPTAEAIMQKFGDAVLVLPGDDRLSGKPSSIIDLTQVPYQLVREGDISLEMLQQVLGDTVQR